jgi:hypothetical protein
MLVCEHGLYPSFEFVLQWFLQHALDTGLHLLLQWHCGFELLSALSESFYFRLEAFPVSGVLAGVSVHLLLQSVPLPCQLVSLHLVVVGRFS